ncbi:MAG: copper amine oxidase N-terminal domain-containing protein [Armatimonadetes bacterium]|nr:copper amine oxidase N-terminal domain-containing protein [Armatimonadota bacterium]
MSPVVPPLLSRLLHLARSRWGMLILGLCCLYGPGQTPARAIDVQNLDITQFRVSPKAVRVGEAVTIDFTLFNRSGETATTQDPPPGTVYRQGEGWDAREFERVPGRVRLGVSISGPRGYAYPYRWGLGAPLPPAQSRRINGKIVFTQPGAYTLYAAVFVEGQGYRRAIKRVYGVRVTGGRRPRPGGVRALVPPTRIMVNGEPINSPQPPVIIRGTAYVPIRFPAEHLGAKVDWNNRTKQAFIQRGTRNVRLQIGNLNAWVNGDLVTLYERPFIRNARTYVPLRFVAEALGGTVTWDGQTKTIRIQS